MYSTEKLIANLMGLLFSMVVAFLVTGQLLCNANETIEEFKAQTIEAECAEYDSKTGEFHLLTPELEEEH